MKILFIRPRLSDPAEEIKAPDVATPREPLGILSVGAALPDRHEVEFIEMQYEDNLEEALEKFQPDVIGAACFTPCSTYSTHKLLERVKRWNPEVFTVVGGKGATYVPENFNREDVDAVVIGEGEITFEKLVTALEQGRDYTKIEGIGYRENGRLVLTKPRPITENLDDISQPARNMSRKYEDHYHSPFAKTITMGIISSTRGCNFGCRFCTCHQERKIRQHSVDRIVNEIQNMEHSLIDDISSNFLVNPEWVENFITRMKQRKLSKDFYLHIPTQSIYQNPELMGKMQEICKDEYILFTCADFIQDKYMKKYNKVSSMNAIRKTIQIAEENNIHLGMTLAVDPDFNEDDFKMLKDFVLENRRIDIPYFTVITPYPGTPLYEEWKDRIFVKDWRYYDGCHIVVTPKLPLERFQENFDSLWHIARARTTQLTMSQMKTKDVDFDILEKYLEDR